MAPKMRRATPRQIARSLRELEALFRPPDPDPGIETAPVGKTGAADTTQSRQTPEDYANRTRRARGAR